MNYPPQPVYKKNCDIIIDPGKCFVLLCTVLYIYIYINGLLMNQIRSQFSDEIMLLYNFCLPVGTCRQVFRQLQGQYGCGKLFDIIKVQVGVE